MLLNSGISRTCPLEKRCSSSSWVCVGPLQGFLKEDSSGVGLGGLPEGSFTFLPLILLILAALVSSLGHSNMLQQRWSWEPSLLREVLKQEVRRRQQWQRTSMGSMRPPFHVICLAGHGTASSLRRQVEPRAPGTALKCTDPAAMVPEP